MEFFLPIIRRYAKGLINEQVGTLLRPAARQIRRIAAGVVLALISAFVWCLVALALLAALFLSLSSERAWAVPALWTAGAGIVIGLILLLSGIRLIRHN